MFNTIIEFPVATLQMVAVIVAVQDILDFCRRFTRHNLHICAYIFLRSFFGLIYKYLDGAIKLVEQMKYPNMQIPEYLGTAQIIPKAGFIFCLGSARCFKRLQIYLSVHLSSFQVLIDWTCQLPLPGRGLGFLVKRSSSKRRHGHFQADVGVTL